MKINYLGVLLCVFFFGIGANSLPEDSMTSYSDTLSSYDFFEGTLVDLNPKEGVIPYELNTPLFSDYTEKIRFIVFPKGKKAIYQANQVFEFPIGTTIIKNFYYPKDARKPEKGRTLLETRLLIHEASGWKALPYVWNDEQTDAYLEVAGGDKAIQWRDANGKKRTIDYTIPNMNQCKGCHLKGKELVPIGPSARQLNRLVDSPQGRVSQLSHWQANDYLDSLPNMASVPQLAVWNDPNTGTLDARARAYLDANCGHCHNEKGPANTSGLNLNVQEKDPTKWGVFKSPIAAGRGSGKRLYNIVPGKPNESILVYRMESDDPGVMMPEVSRQLVHKEGVALIKEWIASL